MIHRIVRAIPLFVFLPLASAGAASPPPSTDVAATVAAAKDVPAMAVLLQQQIHGLSDLMLKIQDAESLAKVVPAIRKSETVVEAIAQRLKTMPVPSPTERMRISSQMEAADAAEAKKKQAAFRKHMGTLSPELREAAQREGAKFFKVLDTHAAVFKQYLQPDETNEPPGEPKK